MVGTTKRLSVALDHRLLAEARRLTRSRTKRATIAKALEELVKLERRKALAHALGAGIFETTEAEFRSRRPVARMPASDLGPRLIDTSFLKKQSKP
ncbi:MAG: type II toxin-antitoxin system VapB family antitoxin [Nitrospirae bacterium]|nr:type II toxin-antitoxin system VapB family antitoxin [Nitrospirota bacterium]